MSWQPALHARLHLTQHRPVSGRPNDHISAVAADFTDNSRQQPAGLTVNHRRFAMIVSLPVIETTAIPSGTSHKIRRSRAWRRMAVTLKPGMRVRRML